MDDRSSFGPELGEQPVEEEQGRNRVFFIIAIGMVGLILIGLLAVVYYFIYEKPRRDEQRAAQATQVVAEATAVARETALAPTDTPLPTPTPVPTNTPLPTPTPRVTNTPVLPPAGTLEPGAPTPTRTPVGSGQIPATGIGGLGAVLAAVGLVAVILIARKLRLTT